MVATEETTAPEHVSADPPLVDAAPNEPAGVEAEYSNPQSTTLEPFNLAKEHLDMLDVLVTGLRGCFAFRKRKGLSTELDTVSLSKNPEESRATICLHWVQR